MSRLEWVACLFVFGFALLFTFRNADRLEPMSAFGEVPSAESLESMAASRARSFGIDVTGWNRLTTTSRDGDLRFLYQKGMLDPGWRLRTPYLATVSFYGPSGQVTRVRIDNQGSLVGISFRKEEIADTTSSAVNAKDYSAEELNRARELALDAFADRWRRGASVTPGVDLGFRLTADAVPRDDGIEFEWTSSADPGGFLAWRVECLVRDGALARLDVIPVTLERLRNEIRESERIIEPGVFVSIALGFCGLIAACVYVIVNLYRRRLPWSFFWRTIAVVSIIVLLDLILGTGQRARGWRWYTDTDAVLGYLLSTAFAVGSAAVLLCAGRSLRAVDDFGRWLGVEDFLRLNWGKGSVVRSTWRAGMVAIWLMPVALTAVLLYPEILLDSPNRRYLGLPFPFFASLTTLSSYSILFAVGFVFPLANAFVRSRVLRIAVALPVAAIGLAPASLIEAPASAIVLTSLVVATILGYSYSRFGVLAAILGALLAMPLLQAITLSAAGDTALQSWSFAFLTGISLVAAVSLILDIRNPAREQEQLLSEDEFAALKRESEREVISRRERLLGEFALAQQAQQRMLPDHPPYVEGFEISAICTPAQQVGGDLYDYIRLSDSRWACCVADVSGKGVSAALYMTMIKGLLNALSLERADLTEIVTILNQHIYQVIRRRSFVTMALAAIDTSTREIEVMRAGHLPVLYVSAAGETRFVESKGIGLGLVSSAAFCRNLNSAKVPMTSGDVAVLYSDGVTEAMNSDRDEFGEDRFSEVVASSVGKSAIEIRDRILEEIRAFQAGAAVHDDITVLVIRALPNSAGGEPRTLDEQEDSLA